MMQGTVASHTIIRVPDKAHAGMAPFVLLLVDLGGGKHVLGHFSGDAPPAIGARVRADSSDQQTPLFRVQETS
jgi:uncharacterized OB-fold protein